MSPRHRDPALWCLLAVAFLLRAGSLALHPRAAGGGDQGLHYVLGVLVSRLGPEPLGWWPPGYELALGGVFAVFGPEPWPALALQTVLSTATVGLLYGIVRGTGGRRAARIAAGLCAVQPSFIAFSGYFYSETLFIFLLAAAFYALLRKPEPGALELVSAGASLGLCVLTRSVVLWFLPLWIGWEVVRGRPERARQVGIVLGVALLVVLPWTLRNAARYGGFLLVDGTMGRTASLAYAPGDEAGLRARDLGLERRGEPRAEARCPLEPLEGIRPLPPVAELEAWFPPAESLSVLSRARGERAGAGRPRAEILSAKLGKARERTRLDLVAQQRCALPLVLAAPGDDPLGWGRAALERLYVFWGPNSFLLRAVHDGAYTRGPLSSYPLVKWAVVTFYVGVIAAAVLALGRRSPPLLVEWSVLFIGYYTAIHAVSAAHSRYRLPAMLFAIALAAVWLARPRPPEGRVRLALVSVLLLAFAATSFAYVATVLP